MKYFNVRITKTSQLFNAFKDTFLGHEHIPTQVKIDVIKKDPYTDILQVMDYNL